MRLGLRYVRELGEAEITRIEGARFVGGPFTGVVDLAQRTGLKVEGLEGLAAAGALASLGVERREGMWAAGALAGMGPGRLALAEGAEAPPLAPMTPAEEAQADLWSTGVSVRHPVEFIREWLAGRGCLTIAEVLGGRHGRRVAVGGLITHRQRPMTAKGVIFLNLEDETGLLNVVVLPGVWDANREVARARWGWCSRGWWSTATGSPTWWPAASTPGPKRCATCAPATGPTGGGEPRLASPTAVGEARPRGAEGEASVTQPAAGSSALAGQQHRASPAGVAAGAAVEDVCAAAAGQVVVAPGAAQLVVARAAAQDIGIGSAQEEVGVVVAVARRSAPVPPMRRSGPRPPARKSAPPSPERRSAPS